LREGANPKETIAGGGGEWIKKRKLLRGERIESRESA